MTTPAVLEQLRQHTVGDRRADLALDVVADDRDAVLREALGPVLVRRDEDRHAVDERDAGLECLLGVEASGLLGTDRQVADQHVGLRVAEDLRDVDRQEARTR